MLSTDQNQDLVEKKLLGSGGYAFAKLTKQEEIKASLGVPQIFLGFIISITSSSVTGLNS